MSVLVTGGAGYIGSFMVALLRESGEDAVVLDNLSAGHRAAVPEGVPFYEGDTNDLALVEKIVKEHNVKEVIHFAAFTSVPESVAKPAQYFQNNTINTFNLLNCLRELGVERFIFSSTAATYGEPRHTPIDEAHPNEPTNPYGHSKLFVEQILRSFDVAYGMKHIALRYFNAAGGAPERGEDHTPETHLIPLILQVALGQRESISIFGDDYPTPDGTCVRDYIHIEDLCSAHLLALEYLRNGGESQSINLGNGKGYSVKEVIEVARRITGHAIPAVTAPRRAGDPSTLVASSEKAKQILNWAPQKPDLETIVETAWQWHSTHPNGYDYKEN